MFCTLSLTYSIIYPYSLGGTLQLCRSMRDWRDQPLTQNIRFYLIRKSIFTTAADGDTIHLNYGAADTRIAMATGSVKSHENEKINFDWFETIQLDLHWRSGICRLHSNLRAIFDLTTSTAAAVFAGCRSSTIQRHILR